MSGLSRFDFYPRDWHLDTRDLTNAAKGIYIDLITAMYARGGPLPHNERELCRITGCATVRSMRPLLQELLDKGKIKLCGEAIINNRTQEEIAAANSRITNAREGGKTRSRPVPAEYEPNTSRTQAVTRPNNEQKQGDSVCIPSPSPPLVTSKNNYAFAGKVIKLNKKDLSTWRNSYSAIPDIMASLQSRDDWLATQPEHDQHKWFVSTSVVLKKEHERTLAEHEHESESQRVQGAIY